jgi:hypothetical protein
MQRVPALSAITSHVTLPRAERVPRIGAEERDHRHSFEPPFAPCNGSFALGHGAFAYEPFPGTFSFDNDRAVSGCVVPLTGEPVITFPSLSAFARTR